MKLAKYDESLEAYDKAIEIDSRTAEFWYNRSCAYSLKKNKENTLSDLRQAINLSASLKEDAKKDKDFEWLWEDEEFIKLTR